MANKKSLISNFSIVSVWTLFSRILGFLRDIFMALYLGSGPVAQAFLLAFTIPNMLRRIFAEGSFNKVFIPIFISVKESKDLTFQITALEHNTGKYAFVEDGTALPARVTTVLTSLKDAPSNLSAEEKIVVVDDKAVSKIFLNWQRVPGVSKYQVQLLKY